MNMMFSKKAFDQQAVFLVRERGREGHVQCSSIAVFAVITSSGGLMVIGSRGEREAVDAEIFNS